MPPFHFAFDLEISGEHGRRRGLIVWRNDRQIGVVFDLDERFGNRGKSDEEAATNDRQLACTGSSPFGRYLGHRQTHHQSLGPARTGVYHGQQQPVDQDRNIA